MKNYKSGGGSPGRNGDDQEPDQPRRIDVRTLMDGSQEVLLSLDGEIYRLRITSKGRLILTK